MRNYFLLFILLLPFFNVVAVSNNPLAKEVCETIGATPEMEKKYGVQCREKDTNAVYSDLNSDGTKELVVSYLGGSCGSQFYVFKLNKAMKWQEIGNWCGCEDGIFKVLKSKHNGFLDIKTCGVSGLFDGKSYVGTRQ
jgi:hypothetical protein